MLTASTKAMKYLLFIFNFVFVLTGIALITIGIITKSATSEYDSVLADKDGAPDNLLIFIGIFIFIVAFFGCCGALRENHCMIVTFSVIMTAIFVAEVAVGVTGYMLRGDAAEELTNGLDKSMAEYSKSNDTAKFWDNMQTQLSCCGTKNYTDWLPLLNKTLPLSCCTTQKGKIGVVTCSVTSEYLHKTPCVDAVANIVRENASTIGFTALVIAVIQLLGVVFSCYLAYSIRNNYESV